MKTHVVIVAAGQSRRFGGSTPKQYGLLEGRPVLWHSISRFAGLPYITAIQVVIAEGHESWYAQAIALLTPAARRRLLPPVYGGKERSDSVLRGLEAIAPAQPDYVMVHDAARPFFSERLITQLYTALSRHAAVIPVVPLADCIKRTDGTRLLETLERDSLRAAQTPQAFHYAVLCDAYKRAPTRPSYYDEAHRCEMASIPVHSIEGERENHKITFQEDDMERYETRIGTGFDTHRFSEDPGANRPIMLGGVAVPHTHAIIAHSDGDVVLHALVDALLGTCGEGDIGQHFPPSDPQWAGKDSSHFVSHALFLLQTHRGHVINVDVTILAEMPKIGPYRSAMQAHIAALLSIAPTRVNIKATTTEHMGYIGRKEGIAAIVSVSVSMRVAQD